MRHYNGVSMYAHQVSRSVIKLEACLMGLGGGWDIFVHYLPLTKGFRNLDIVHLEMINIVWALCLLSFGLVLCWSNATMTPSLRS